MTARLGRTVLRELTLVALAKALHIHVHRLGAPGSRRAQAFQQGGERRGLHILRLADRWVNPSCQAAADVEKVEIHGYSQLQKADELLSIGGLQARHLNQLLHRHFMSEADNVVIGHA